MSEGSSPCSGRSSKSQDACYRRGGRADKNERGRRDQGLYRRRTALDIAIDRAAAEEKGAMDRKITGDADILLFPDIHAGNLVYKAIVHLVKVKNGCILTGTKAPVILTSRSDTFETKVNSIALAAVVAEEMKKNQ